jgi:spore maturation protein CgeB
MGLNLSRTNSVKYYTSNRISSLIGNGLMTFIDIRTQLNDFFDDDEVVFYKNVNDLSEKLNYFRENDSFRKKIARKGQEKYFRYFNSDLVMKYVLSKVFDFNLVNKKKWMNS